MKNLVSLGHDCQIKNELSRRGYYINSAIADMTSATLDGVIHLLENDFADFFLKENVTLINTSKMFVCNTKVIAFHDHKNRLYSYIPISDYKKDVPFSINLQRYLDYKIPQIQEFQEILKNTKYIQIIRTNVNEESVDTIVRLRDTIAKVRGDLPFDLYVLQDSKFMQDNWGIPNLHTFYLQHWIWEDRWIGDSDVWEKIYFMINQPRSSKLYL